MAVMKGALVAADFWGPASFCFGAVFRSGVAAKFVLVNHDAERDIDRVKSATVTLGDDLLEAPKGCADDPDTLGADESSDVIEIRIDRGF